MWQLQQPVEQPKQRLRRNKRRFFWLERLIVIQKTLRQHRVSKSSQMRMSSVTKNYRNWFDVLCVFKFQSTQKNANTAPKLFVSHVSCAMTALPPSRETVLCAASAKVRTLKVTGPFNQNYCRILSTRSRLVIDAPDFKK